MQKQPTLKYLQKQPNQAKIGKRGTSNITKATNPTNNRRIVILPERDSNGGAKHERAAMDVRNTNVNRGDQLQWRNERK